MLTTGCIRMLRHGIPVMASRLSCHLAEAGGGACAKEEGSKEAKRAVVSTGLHQWPKVHGQQQQWSVKS